MRFLGCNFTQNALAAGAPPGTPLGELKRSSKPLADFRGCFAAGEGDRRGKMEEGKGKGVLGKGKREGREREEGKEGKGGEGEFASLVLGGDRRPCD